MPVKHLHRRATFEEVAERFYSAFSPTCTRHCHRHFTAFLSSQPDAVEQRDSFPVKPLNDLSDGVFGQFGERLFPLPYDFLWSRMPRHATPRHARLYSPHPASFPARLA